ncbi:MAG: DAK2 domain-containing protein, partial [Planctomycetota bacterium]|nr:DAK2 domain-containing protein [Planctomycetota bacterium]
MSGFPASIGNDLVMDMTKVIQKNKEYLGEIDGAIGDGDHGVNMNKGFTFYEERHGNEPADVATAFKNLSQILMGEIGGSM